jgi:cobalt-zinc-cadmium efflux system membrane fusion protein
MTETFSSDPEGAPSHRYTGLTVGLAVLVALVLGATGALVLGRSGNEAPRAPEPAEAKHELPSGAVEVPVAAQRNAGVQVAAVRVDTLPAMIAATGVVAADDSRVAHVRSLARGVVEKVHVSLGSRVTAGQPLLELDNIELGELIGRYLSERAGLQQTDTDLDVKRRSLDRARELIKIEAISRQELDQREAEVKNAEAAVASQRARLSQVEEQIHRFGLTDADLAKVTPADTQSGHRDASHSTVRAPFAGTITRYDVAVGEAVDSQSELLTVADMSTVWVLADVYEKDLGRLAKVDKVQIDVDAYPSRAFNGRLTHISDLIDPKTRAAKVRVVVPNVDGALKLEMFVRAAIPTRDRKQGLLVPVGAVQYIDNQPVVFVRESETRFVRRLVRLGATANEVVEVLEGVKAGEPVVSEGSFYLKTALLRERIGGEG